MNFFNNLLKKGATTVIDSVGGVLDKLITNKEELIQAKLEVDKEVNRHIEVMIGQADEIEKAYLADVQSARETNAKIQGDSPSWLAKNLAYIIDLFVTILWGGLTTYLMAIMLNLAPKQTGVDYTAVTAVWGAVSATFGTVINFHRGSSQGSTDKQKILDRLTK
jgi:hypothetical protein